MRGILRLLVFGAAAALVASGSVAVCYPPPPAPLEIRLIDVSSLTRGYQDPSPWLEPFPDLPVVDEANPLFGGEGESPVHPYGTIETSSS
jgi:hypothetical protein